MVHQFAIDFGLFKKIARTHYLLDKRSVSTGLRKMFKNLRKRPLTIGLKRTVAMVLNKIIFFNPFKLDCIKDMIPPTPEEISDIAVEEYPDQSGAQRLIYYKITYYRFIMSISSLDKS